MPTPFHSCPSEAFRSHSCFFFFFKLNLVMSPPPPLPAPNPWVCRGSSWTQERLLGLLTQSGVHATAPESPSRCPMAGHGPQPPGIPPPAQGQAGLGARPAESRGNSNHTKHVAEAANPHGLCPQCSVSGTEQGLRKPWLLRCECPTRLQGLEFYWLCRAEGADT